LIFSVYLVYDFFLDGNKDGAKYKNLMNWSCAIGYGVGSGSPLSPSFNFGLELAKSSQVILQIVQIISEFSPKSHSLSPSLSLNGSLVLQLGSISWL
jgi:hypothetical protein